MIRTRSSDPWNFRQFWVGDPTSFPRGFTLGWWDDLFMHKQEVDGVEATSARRCLSATSSVDDVNRYPLGVQTSKLVEPWELKTCKGKYSSIFLITISLPILSDYLAQMIGDIKKSAKCFSQILNLWLQTVSPKRSCGKVMFSQVFVCLQGVRLPTVPWNR